MTTPFDHFMKAFTDWLDTAWYALASPGSPARSPVSPPAAGMTPRLIRA
ncbi:MAG TPA: hypothetical protein PK282_09140 [Rhodoglobus sp.]|nr:hypothetical protein [Rhodoglobus sp.]